MPVEGGNTALPTENKTNQLSTSAWTDKLQQNETKGEGNQVSMDMELVTVLQRCLGELGWEKRLAACKELTELVNSQRVRDVEKLPSETYPLLFDTLLLGWQQQEDELRDDIQAAFRGIIRIPEFETAVAGDSIGKGLLAQLCARFHAGVSEERLFLRETLHWVYASFPQKRIFLRHQIGSVLSQFVRAPSRNTHIAELLQVVCQIVKGFPKSLTQVHRSLLTGIILPLHEPNEMAVWSLQQPLIENYHEALVGCLIPFLERQPGMLRVIFESIVAAWPQGFQSNTPKEVLLLHEIGTLIKLVPSDSYRAVLSVVMPKILGCLRVDNSRVVERALFLFKDDMFMKIIGWQGPTSLQPILSALLRGGEPFWNPTVTKMTAHVLEALEALDPGAFAAACETLWGDGARGTADFSDNSENTTCISTQSNKEAASHPASTAASGLPPPTLKVAMKKWRHEAAGGTGHAGATKVTRNPPSTVTGVAPWAFSTPQPSSGSRVADRLQVASNGASGRAPPFPSLKRPLQGASAAPNTDGRRSNSYGESTTSTVVGVDPAAVRESRGGDCESDAVGAVFSRKSWETSKDAASEPREHARTGVAPSAASNLTPIVGHTRDSYGAIGGGLETEGAVPSGARDQIEGPGLQRVRDFILKIKPKEAQVTSGPSWQQLQLEPTPTLLPDLRFHDLVFGHELGKGSFSSVKYARQIMKGQSRSEWPEFAVKVISTTKIKELQYDNNVTNEIACLRVLSHPGIARLISAFRWRDGAYLVLEYASRGDLHTHIKQHGSLTETSTRFVIGEVIAALCSVHGCGFVFGDLKPENILITESGHVKIADFGACRAATAAAKDILNHSRDALRTLRDGDWRVTAGLPPNPLYTLPVESEHSDSDREGGVERDIKDGEIRAEGTAAYLPPEVAQGSAPDIGADAWALGCVTFLCLAGRPPIFAETDEATLARVVTFACTTAKSNNEGGGVLPSLPSEVSHAPKSLVNALMEPDPKVRLSVEYAAKHDFLVEGGVDVFSLHCHDPVELAQGIAAPAPNAAWSRRQNSMIWAPMPQEYRFEVVLRELDVIPETEVERGAPFQHRFATISEP